MLSLWKSAMLLILPLMWHEWHLRGVDPQKLRVWLAMFGGAFVAWAIPELLPWIPGRHQLGLYVLLDIAIAGVILAQPRGLPQKSIGSLSGFMVLFGVGYLISVLRGGENPDMYKDVMSALGWARWGILFSWGAGLEWLYIAFGVIGLRWIAGQVLDETGSVDREKPDRHHRHTGSDLRGVHYRSSDDREAP